MMEKILKILILVVLFILLTGSSENKINKTNNSVLLMENLYYKGLPLKTSKDNLIKILGKPDLKEDRESIQPLSKGRFGNSVSYSLYTYNVADGSLSFSVHKNQAVIFHVNFSDNLILKYGKIKLTNKFSYKRALKLFNATKANETSKRITRKLLIFRSNSKSNLKVYATPILKFKENYLESLFYYPEF